MMTSSATPFRRASSIACINVEFAFIATSFPYLFPNIRSSLLGTADTVYPMMEVTYAQTSS